MTCDTCFAAVHRLHKKKVLYLSLPFPQPRPNPHPQGDAPLGFRLQLIQKASDCNKPFSALGFNNLAMFQKKKYMTLTRTACDLFFKAMSRQNWDSACVSDSFMCRATVPQLIILKRHDDHILGQLCSSSISGRTAEWRSNRAPPPPPLHVGRWKREE